MSILRYGPKPGAATLSYSGDNRRFNYIVVCSTTTEDPFTVLAKITTAYGHYKGVILAGTNFYCSDLVAEQQSDGKIWNVTATYTRTSTSTSGLSAITPLDEPWAVSCNHVPRREVLASAYSRWNKVLMADGSVSETVVAPAATPASPVSNSFGDVFDPPYEKDVRLLQLILSKNVSISAFNALGVNAYDDTLNDAAITVLRQSIPIYCGLLNVDYSRHVYYNNSGTAVFYMTVNYTITIDKRTHAVRLVDQGLRYKKRTDPNKDSVVQATASGMAGQREPKPVKLSGTGYALKDANVEGDFGGGLGASAVLQCFFASPAKSWTPLGLPSASDSY